jgi:hypothetical protein
MKAKILAIVNFRDFLCTHTLKSDNEATVCISSTPYPPTTDICVSSLWTRLCHFLLNNLYDSILKIEEQAIRNIYKILGFLTHEIGSVMFKTCTISAGRSS